MTQTELLAARKAAIDKIVGDPLERSKMSSFFEATHGRLLAIIREAVGYGFDAGVAVMEATDKTDDYSQQPPP